ncbi:hypothetical protein SAMN05660916_02215 [Arthrobacter sp. 31Cvi3.1E]|nr:hypothetical protein SAMN05660916_02215 [Arthrobacter sp. 31Cvi3.1E]
MMEPGAATRQRPPSRGMIDLTVQDPDALDYALENAVETVKEAANFHGTGILITKTGPGHFVIRPTPPSHTDSFDIAPKELLRNRRFLPTPMDPRRCQKPHPAGLGVCCHS